MGSRIRVYALKKSDYKRNVGKMDDDKLEEVLDRSREVLFLDRKALSKVVANNLDIRAGHGKKVSITTGNKLSKAMKKGMFALIEEICYDMGNLSDESVSWLVGAGLVVEAFNLKKTNKLYGGYFVIYA